MNQLWLRIKEHLETLNGSGRTKWFLAAIAVVVIFLLVRAAYNDQKAGVFEEKEPNTNVGVAAPNVKDPSIDKLVKEAEENRREMAKMRKLFTDKLNQPNNDNMSREEAVRLFEELRKTDLTGREQAEPFNQGDSKTTVAPLGETGMGQGANLPASSENISSSQAKPAARFSRSPQTKGSQGQDSAEDNKTYLPPGTILSYVLLSGVNAPTNLDGKDEHAPMVLLRIKGKGIMPNGFTTDLSDCFVLAAAYGQYMDSRAIARPTTISCVRDDGKAVEAKLKGEINGEDGKPGWQGRVVSKDGKVLAGLFRIGVAQTTGETLSNAANGFNINIGGSSSNGNPRTQVNLGGAAGQSTGKNFGNAFNKMAEYYEKRGNEVIPVIEVPPLRTGEIIVQTGVTLEFVKDVR